MIKFILLFLYSFITLASDNLRLINVDGVAEKSFKPNIILLNVNIWSKAEKAKDALSDQVFISNKVKKIISQYKIDDKDIMTTGFELNPNYIWDQKTNQNKNTGYNANESISIILRNIESAGKFIDEISMSDKKFGVNISGMIWDISNRDEIQKELLSEAVKVAIKKAELLATSAGVKLKRIYTISPISGNNLNPPMPNLKMMSESMAARDSAPQLQSGQIKVSNSVSLNYEIE